MDFDAATNAPIKKEVGPVPNKRFGPSFAESKTDAKLKQTDTRLSTSHGACPNAGTDDMSHAGTMAPLKGQDFVNGNRPMKWPPSFEKK